MHVLLTGAGGMVGRAMVPRILKAGHSITGLIRSESPPPTAINGLNAVEADLSAEVTKWPTPLLESEPDLIIHAAARSPGKGVKTADYERDNVRAANQVIAFAERGGAVPIVFLSAISTYGEVTVDVVDENTPVNDPGAYGASKLACERALAGASGVPSLVLRLPGVLGPGAHTPWVAKLKERIRNRCPVSVFNPDAPFNNAVHVDDLCDLIMGLEPSNLSDSDTLTLGAADAIPVRRVAEVLMEALGARVGLEVGPSSEKSFTISSEKARRRYGYQPMEIEKMVRKFAAE